MIRQSPGSPMNQVARHEEIPQRLDRGAPPTDLDSQFQSGCQQSVRHFGLPHEPDQELMEFSGSVFVGPYQVPELGPGSGGEVVELRHAFDRAVQQAPLTRKVTVVPG